MGEGTWTYLGKTYRWDETPDLFPEIVENKRLREALSEAEELLAVAAEASDEGKDVSAHHFLTRGLDVIRAALTPTQP